MVMQKSFNSDINALTPVIFTLSNQEAVKDTASAIQDVSP
jgi:hypothetical protein